MPKKKEPIDPNVVDRKTVLYYVGRRLESPGYYFYIVGDTGKEVRFKKRLQRNHRIGYGYPVTISNEGNTFATNGIDAPVDGWSKAKDITNWIRSDKLVIEAEKRLKENGALPAEVRKFAEKIRDGYKRANSLTKRDIIAAFIETLES